MSQSLFVQESIRLGIEELKPERGMYGVIFLFFDPNEWIKIFLNVTGIEQTLTCLDMNACHRNSVSANCMTKPEFWNDEVH
jgi:hypothetical protein